MDSRKITCMAAAAFLSSMLILSTAYARPIVVHGHAQIDPDTQRVVPYGDLNLANTDGQKRLIRRVGYAVNDLCDVNRFAARDLVTLRGSRECATTAWLSANPQIKSAFERAQSGAFVSATAVTITLGR